MPIITVSRGSFSGGLALADSVAALLDYPCVSREVILDAAWEYGVNPEKLVTAMEKPPSFWQQLSGERLGYLSFIRAALCERARSGRLVYHGHAGHLLLDGISHVIRVRVIADMEFRVEAAMQVRGLNRKEATLYIKKVDQERVRWTRFLYGVDWYDASLYDVVLNINRMTIEGACQAVARIAELPEFQPTPDSQRAMENLTLSSKVWAILARDPRTAIADIRVVSDDGVVTITGTTRSQEAVDLVPILAAQVEGVVEARSHVGLGSVFVK